MSVCVQTEKPLISIVMAVYEPHQDWLREQLKSLNTQTYPNLELIVRDDCSQRVPFTEIKSLIAACIDAMPYSVSRNSRNMGSTATFELLTAQACGTYIAYCDQDDIWLPEKLETLCRAIEESGAELACSDMLIIDGEGNQVAGSIAGIRRHHVFRSGCGLTGRLLFFNFVTGCTMLIRAETAKAAIPFCPYMVHDHWLALYSAEKGEICSLQDKLIQYRVHGDNQTDIMAGVKDRESYLKIRIVRYLERMNWLQVNFDCSAPIKEKIDKGIVWLEAREYRMRHRGGGTGAIWRYKTFSLPVSVFELAAPYLSDRMFMRIVELKRKNVI